MTIRDRTQEFFATVDSFQQYGHIISIDTFVNSTILPKDCLDHSSKLNNLANQITDKIDDVQQKIDQLEELAKMTSNLRDEHANIQVLSGMISEDVRQLNDDISLYLHSRPFYLNLLAKFLVLIIVPNITKQCCVHYRLDILNWQSPLEQLVMFQPNICSDKNDKK